MSKNTAPLAAFADALLKPGGPVPAGIIAACEPPLASRFDVYRNNVFASLIDALKDSFPVVERLLGASYFRALAREFIIAYPPASPVLLEYGAGFAAFLENFKPLEDMPWLADTARLERAWLSAYHAADENPLGTQDFAAIAPAQIPHIRLTLHPSARLLRSFWPIATIWRANQDGATQGEIDLDAGGEDVLIVRPQSEVVLHTLPEGSHPFINALINGADLTSAHKAASAQNDAFDLSLNLAHLIAGGAFVTISHPSRKRSEQ